MTHNHTNNPTNSKMNTLLPMAAATGLNTPGAGTEVEELVLESDGIAIRRKGL